MATLPCQLSLAANANKDAYKAMLKLITYNAEGKQLSTGTAFFVGNNTQVATSYSALKDAYKVEVIDFKGNKYPLHRILGANATTDLVLFSINEAPKKGYFFNISATTSHKGANLQMWQYSTNKKAVSTTVSVERAEPFDSYTYYYTNAANNDANFACPLTDDEGNIVAILQKNVAKDATGACAIDARFFNDMKIKVTDAFNTDLASLHLPKALPTNQHDALSFLYIYPQADSTLFVTACQDYIQSYPSMPDGYVVRANFLANKAQYAQAQTDYNTALQCTATCKDSTAMTAADIHYALSNQIYRNITAQGKDTLQAFKQWTLTEAIVEVDKAYAATPSPLYLVHKGKCYYAKRQYKEAYENFARACEDKAFASCETYFWAARTLELSQGDNQQVIALLDSCIALIPEKAGAQFAQFYIERSQRLLRAQKYREAVKDYNTYEQLVGPRNLNERFYYLRAQAEEHAHMYQQALDDYNSAITQSKQPEFYQVEKAAFLLNIGEFAAAADAAEKVLKVMPQNSDCYKIMGIAHGELKHKALAVKYLQKAQELGDNSVESFLKKYNK